MSGGGVKRLIVGLSGASGAPLAVACLEELRRHPDWEVHLIVSRGAAETIRYETDRTLEEVKALAHICHDMDAIGAGPASGTFRAQDPTIEHRMIRINPMRSGPDTILRILRQCMDQIRGQ